MILLNISANFQVPELSSLENRGGGAIEYIAPVAGHMGPRHVGPWTSRPQLKTYGPLTEDIWAPNGHLGPWTSRPQLKTTRPLN